MDIRTKSKLDLMAQNYIELKEHFIWDANPIKHFCALIYAENNKTIDAEYIKEIRKYIKESTGWTSDYRGGNELILSVLLSLEEDYRNFFEELSIVHEMMRNADFKKGIYLPLAAYTIAKNVPSEMRTQTIERMKIFYSIMKENHFWLTSQDDYIYAAILGASELEPEVSMKKVEDCYNKLNQEGFWKGNDLQSLSHILAFGEADISETCSKALRLYEILKKDKCKLQYSGLSTLGVLTLIVDDEEALVSEIKEAADYLSDKKGYGMWSLDTSLRVMLAASIVSSLYADDVKSGVLKASLAGSIQAITIAQQQAAAAAACAVCASASASNS